MAKYKKCGSRIFLVDETITHLEIYGEIIKELGSGDLHNRKCLRCTEPHIYEDYKHLVEGVKTARDRRCCRNCVHFNPQDSTCPEGGFSEIGDPWRALSEEDCSGFCWRYHRFLRSLKTLDREQISHQK